MAQRLSVISPAPAALTNASRLAIWSGESVSISPSGTGAQLVEHRTACLGRAALVIFHLRFEQLLAGDR